MTASQNGARGTEGAAGSEVSSAGSSLAASLGSSLEASSVVSAAVAPASSPEPPQPPSVAASTRPISAASVRESRTTTAPMSSSSEQHAWQGALKSCLRIVPAGRGHQRRDLLRQCALRPHRHDVVEPLVEQPLLVLGDLEVAAGQVRAVDADRPRGQVR